MNGGGGALSFAIRALLTIMVGLSSARTGAAGAETRLIDQFGRPLDSRQLNGHWLLVYFGYASCRQICPASLTTMTSLLKGLGPLADSIDPLFVTLDPLHDSPQVMRAFAAHFDPRIRALTGSVQSVTEAARTFGVPWQSASGGSGIADHGTLFYVVAPDGRVVQVMHPQQPLADLIAALRNRLAEAAPR